MKTELASKVRLLLMVSVFLPVATVCAVEADSFKIDFGIHNGGSPVAEGWNVFGWSTGDVFGPSNLSYVCSNDRIATNGVVTVGVTAGSHKITARNRGQPSDAAVYPMAPVYCDWISSDNNPMWITLSGLHPTFLVLTADLKQRIIQRLHIFRNFRTDRCRLFFQHSFFAFGIMHRKSVFLFISGNLQRCLHTRFKSVDELFISSVDLTAKLFQIHDTSSLLISHSQPFESSMAVLKQPSAFVRTFRFPVAEQR